MPTYKPESAQTAESGRAMCALSSPGRTPNQAVDAKKGDTWQPTAAAAAIESRLKP